MVTFTEKEESSDFEFYFDFIKGLRCFNVNIL